MHNLHSLTKHRFKLESISVLRMKLCITCAASKSRNNAFRIHRYDRTQPNSWKEKEIKKALFVDKMMFHNVRLTTVTRG